MRNMLVVPPESELLDFMPDMVIFNAGGFPAVRAMSLLLSLPRRPSVSRQRCNCPFAPCRIVTSRG